MKRNYQNHGFTIVELLTVMAVIALLIGLLVPGLNKVRIYAKGVKQKAQFHSISVAMEMFKNAEGEYPESSFLPLGQATNLICGANRLAEALVGRDLQGFDPVSKWHPTLDGQTPVTNAYSNVDTGSTPTLKTQSLERRKGPYLDIQNVGAFNACQFFGNPGYDKLYPGPISTTDTAAPAPMLSDIYATKTVQLTIVTGAGTTITTSAKAGMPVLYFKANISSTVFDDQQPGASIYNYLDNSPVFTAAYKLAPVGQQGKHLFYDTYGGQGQVKPFYDKITNPAVTTMLRPYNADSFLLLSAGYDGIYGTSDDIWNFGE